MGPSGPSLPLGKSAFTNTWSPFPGPFQGPEHRVSRHQAFKPKWKPVPLERKRTVVEKGQGPQSVPPTPGVLLFQTSSAQESRMELEISWNIDGQDLPSSGHPDFSREHFLLSRNHLFQKTPGAECL